MNYVSLDFLKENFLGEKIVFFDIGCCNLWDTKNFVATLPDATFYAFEPLKDYYKINLERSIQYGVNFFNYAISDVDEDILFYPSEKQGEQEQLQSSSIFKPTSSNIVSYGEPYMVKSVTIESFCKEHNVSPDFIHIDVEGAEYNVFSKLGEHRPKGIWVEMIGYWYYQNGRSDRDGIDPIDYELDRILKSYGYEVAFQSDNDSLYLHKDAELKNRNYKN
jgi:FkbM family methyltransferase